MANRLADSTSPYLLQHQNNPVDWWEWGPEAFAEAQSSDRPVLLSVGYSACHWCHVMARESFENKAVAAFMNRHFVNIKVDREERPDVDAIYLQATTAMTGHAGWPMTCVLTPDGEPFFAGTYFPPEPRQGSPSFSQILQALADAWQNRREEVLATSGEIVGFLREATLGSPGVVGVEDLDAAATTLLGQADRRNGGFGQAPKFPPMMALEFLMRHAARTGDETGLAVVDQTFEAMARGGLRDQVAGGFARYSVDARWQVPHFEKMLHDNALMVSGYLHWRRTLLDRGDHDRARFAEDICRSTVEFLLNEMLTPEGGFAAALDADSDGHEGTFYVWNREQLVEVLGEEDGPWAAELLNVTETGTFERGFSTLQMLEDPDDAARWQRVRATLHTARERRTRPARDGKVIAAWNALTISALAEAGVVLEEPGWVEAARSAATLLWDTHAAGTASFRRTSFAGVASNHAAVLDDHGLLASACHDLFRLTGEHLWWERATVLLERILGHFADEVGGFFDTADDAEQLIVRPQEFTDNATPSGTSAALAALVTHSAITGDARYRQIADSTVSRLAELMSGAPRFAGWALAQAEALQSGPLQIAIVGEPGTDLHQAALAATAPGAVVVAGPAGLDVPLFEGRDRIEGRDAAYVCRDFVCRMPVTDPTELAREVRS